MSGEGKTGGIIAALVFAVCFGGVGVFATWVIFSTVNEAYSARDWVRVRAEVLKYDADGVSYRYRLGDKEYPGKRLGPGFFEPSEIDSVIHERLEKALTEKKPVTVFVNPADPTRSLVDPEIPWTLVLAMTPFALGFGGVGLGAIYGLVHVLRDQPAEEKPDRIASDAGSGAATLWIFTFLWNAMSFPIAALVVPDALRDGEWGALFVLLFPLVGLLLIWGALWSAWNYVRRGGAVLHLQQAPAQLGRPFAANVVFARGVKAGQAFKAKLACVTAGQVHMTTPHWSAEETARVAEGPQGARLALRFGSVPGKPPQATGLDADEASQWRLELFPEGSSSAAYGFDFEMQPAPGAAMELGEEGGEEEQEEVEEAVTPADLLQIAGGDPKELMARMQHLTPEQKEAVQKIVQHGPLLKKVIFAIIGLFILLQVGGAVVWMLFSN